MKLFLALIMFALALALALALGIGAEVVAQSSMDKAKLLVAQRQEGDSEQRLQEELRFGLRELCGEINPRLFWDDERRVCYEVPLRRQRYVGPGGPTE